MREPPSTGVNKLYAEIDELHNKGNAMRKVLGQPSQPNTDIADIKKQQRPEAALLALREAKASELQLLALKCCGHSTRNCYGGNRLGDRFNLALNLAVVECLNSQADQLKLYTQRHDTLQRENRALRELAGQAGAQKPQPPAAAPRSRPASASAAARVATQHRPPPGRPCTPLATVELPRTCPKTGAATVFSST